MLRLHPPIEPATRQKTDGPVQAVVFHTRSEPLRGVCRWTKLVLFDLTPYDRDRFAEAAANDRPACDGMGRIESSNEPRPSARHGDAAIA